MTTTASVARVGIFITSPLQAGRPKLYGAEHTFKFGVAVGLVSRDDGGDTLTAMAWPRLGRRSTADTEPLRVDITAVTHLGSASVRALIEARQRADRNGSDYVPVAIAGGTPHHVLSLAGLPITVEQRGV